LVVGVNGVGKTTSIGKLAWRFKQAGQQVVVAGVHVLSPGQKVTLYQPVGTKP
jgi:fused signal recognition particle receptor